MKLLLLNFLFVILINQTLYAQNVAINSTGAFADPSALLDLNASPTNNTGFAMPRLTTTQRIAIVAPVAGLQVYDTNLKGFYYFDGTIWDCVSISAGSVDYFANITAPHGYLECNGQSVSKTQYPELFNAIGYTYGGAGANFNVPDLRGEFVRGLDNGRGVDAGRVIGSFQKATTITSDDGSAPAVQGLGNIIENSLDANTDAITIYWNTATVTAVYSGPQYLGKVRPRNVALLPCIKF